MCGDFNCQLQPHAMVREPEHFEQTIFPVDIVHCKTHAQCSGAFDANLFSTQGISDYRLWLDQAVERRNRVLQRVKATSIKMCVEQFMIQLRLSLEIDNRRLV